MFTQYINRRRRTDLHVNDARSIKHFKLIPAYAMHMHARVYASQYDQLYANRACCQVYSFAQPERNANVLFLCYTRRTL